MTVPVVKETGRLARLPRLLPPLLPLPLLLLLLLLPVLLRW
jgi:hypothetical protein